MNTQKVLSNYYMTNCDNSNIFAEHFADVFESELLNIASKNIRDMIVNNYNVYCHFFDNEDSKKVEDYVRDIEDNLDLNSTYFIIIPRFNLPINYKEQILERISSLNNVFKVICPLWDLAYQMTYQSANPGLSKVTFLPDRALFTFEINIEAISTNSSSFMSFGRGSNLIDDKLMDFYQKYFSPLDSPGVKSKLPIKLYCNDITENMEAISEFTERFLTTCNNSLFLESFNFPTLPNRDQESHFSRCKDSFVEIFTYENIRDDIASQFNSYFRSMWYYQEMSVLADLSDDLSNAIRCTFI